MGVNKDRETIGRAFGRLTVLGLASDGPGPRRYICQCSCGATKEVRGIQLRNGNTKSCGCLISEGIVSRSTKHGYASRERSLPEYTAWNMTKQRCENPKQRDYPYYGGRGINLCERWHSFQNFLDDMGRRPEGMTLERVNNSEGYSPENCVWAPRKAQSKNRRTTVMVTCWGQTKTLSEWADTTGIPYHTLKARVRRLGYSPEVALTKPIKPGKTP